MDKLVELIIVKNGNNVHASFYPYEAEYKAPSDTSDALTVNWRVRLIWSEGTVIPPDDISVEVGDFHHTNINTPKTPYGENPLTPLLPKPTQVGNELIWEVTGDPITAIPSSGQQYEWTYSITVKTGEIALHKIDPILVISG